MVFAPGEQPWTDFAAHAGRRLQEGAGQIGGGGTGPAENLGVCDRLTECGNDDPGFTCTACPAGYVGDGTVGCCLDDGTVDCSSVIADPPPPPPPAACDQTFDAYNCHCMPGFMNGACEFENIAEVDAQCTIESGGNCDGDIDECP